MSRYSLRVSVKNVKFTTVKNIGVCYRSPSYTTEENMQLTKVIETAANNCALICGDLIRMRLFSLYSENNKKNYSH